MQKISPSAAFGLYLMHYFFQSPNPALDAVEILSENWIISWNKIFYLYVLTFSKFSENFHSRGLEHEKSNSKFRAEIIEIFEVQMIHHNFIFKVHWAKCSSTVFRMKTINTKFWTNFNHKYEYLRSKIFSPELHIYSVKLIKYQLKFVLHSSI